MTTGPALMEEVERTNVVMVREQEQRMGVAPRRDPYAIEVDRRRNCYICGGSGHMARHCRNWRRGMIADGRRLEYRGERFEGNYEHLNNLKEEKNLESLN